MLVQKENVQLEIKTEEFEKYEANGYKKVKVKADLEEDVLKTDPLKSELEDKTENLEEDVLNPKNTKKK